MSRSDNLWQEVLLARKRTDEAWRHYDECVARHAPIREEIRTRRTQLAQARDDVMLGFFYSVGFLAVVVTLTFMIEGYVRP